MMPSWCRQVNWGNCGIPWVNCSVLCVKTTGKDSSEAWAIACQNCAVYWVFQSRMTSHSKIVHFNWECIAPFRDGFPTDRTLAHKQDIAIVNKNQTIEVVIFRKTDQIRFNPQRSLLSRKILHGEVMNMTVLPTGDFSFIIRIHPCVHER